MNTTTEDARRLADETLDQLHGTMDRTRAQVSDAARRSAERMRDWRDGMREQVGRAEERTVGYVKDEPLKSLALAAGFGALIALAVAAISRNRH